MTVPAHTVFTCTYYIALTQQGEQGPSVAFGRVNCEAESEFNSATMYIYRMFRQTQIPELPQ